MSNSKRWFKAVSVMTAVLLAAGTMSVSAAETTAAEETTVVEAVETTAAETTAEAAETTAAEAAEETTAPAEESAADAAETTAAAEDESSVLQQPADPDFSEGLDEDGYLKDTTLLGLLTLPDYQNAVLSASDLTVTDDEIQERVETLLSNYTKENQVTDREVADGDTVNIDFVGSIDGVEFAGGSTGGNGTNVTIGVTSYIDNFLEQLIGHKPGETINVEVTFPDSYPQNTDLQGKDAVFVTTINYIIESITPELTDEFVEENLKDTYGYSTVEEVKDHIRETLESNKTYNTAWNYFTTESTFSAEPESMINTQMDLDIAILNRQLYNYGMTIEQYLQQTGYYATEEELRESYRADATQVAKTFVIAEAVAKEQGIEVDDATVQEYLESLYPGQDVSIYLDYFGAPCMKMQVRMIKVAECLVELAKTE